MKRDTQKVAKDLIGKKIERKIKKKRERNNKVIRFNSRNRSLWLQK